MDNKINFKEAIKRYVESNNYTLTDEENIWLNNFVEESPDLIATTLDSINTLLDKPTRDYHDVFKVVTIVTKICSSQSATQELSNRNNVILISKIIVMEVLEQQKFVNFIPRDDIEKSIDLAYGLISINIVTIEEVGDEIKIGMKDIEEDVETDTKCCFIWK